MSRRSAEAAGTTGPVRVVGTGLIGTSIGLALRTVGVDVVLSDPSHTTVLLARDVGAGRLAQVDDREPALVVVGAPPDVAAQVVLAELEAHPNAVVTDVASVKSRIADAVRAGGGDLTRYVGSHPMAGSERSGPTGARTDLFAGRPWVVCAGQADPAAVRAVRALAMDVGASPVALTAHEHDAAVAVVSHVPQIAASLVAARLQHADAVELGLAGQGLRDVTRIAASDPALWTSILSANASAVTGVLDALRADLDVVIDALKASEAASVPTSGSGTLGSPADGALGALARMIAAGNAGVAQIPGKHGGSRRAYDVVTVLVPDRPGELARLLTDMGEAKINLEDLAIDHASSQPVGLAALSVQSGLGLRLTAALEERGWRVAG